MKRFQYFEEFEDEDYDYGQDLFSSSKKSNTDDDRHPWDKDFDDEDIPYFTSGRLEEEEEDEDIVYPVEDDGDYIVDHIEHILRESGIRASVSPLATDDIEILVILENQYPFSKFYEIIDVLREISLMEEFRQYTTDVRIWKSTKNQPLIVFELNYKPYTKTTYYTPKKK